MVIRRIALSLLGLSVSAGCDRLALSPGEDLKVHWQDSAALVVKEQVADVEVPIRIEGCEDFELFFEIQNAAEEHARALAFEKDDEGLARTRIPPTFFRRNAATGACHVDAQAQNTLSFAIRAHCLEDGRTVSSELRSASYRATEQVLRMRASTARQLHRGPGPWILALSDDNLAAFEETATGLYATNDVALAANEDHLLANDGSTAWIATPCQPPDCAMADVELSTGGTAQMQAGRLSPIQPLATVTASSTGTADGRDGTGTRAMPGAWHHFAIGPDGDMHFLAASREGGRHLVLKEEKAMMTLLTDSLLSARGFSQMPDGGLALVTASAEERLVRRRGETLEVLGQQQVPVDSALERIDAAPDGATWVAMSPRRIFMGDWNQALELDGGWLLPYGAKYTKVAWSAAFVAIADDEHLAVFARTAPFQKLFERRMPRFTGLWGLAAGADRLAVTTATGLWIYSPEGHVLGGVDPLPCSIVPDGSPPLVLPSGKALFTAGNHLFVLSRSLH